MSEVSLYDRVKSYDFPDGPPERLERCFVEGVVVAFLKVDEGFTFTVDGEERTARFFDCDRYVIRVTRKVFGGKEVEPRSDFVFPPVNGTPRTFSDTPCAGVVKVAA